MLLGSGVAIRAWGLKLEELADGTDGPAELELMPSLEGTNNLLYACLSLDVPGVASIEGFLLRCPALLLMSFCCSC